MISSRSNIYLIQGCQTCGPWARTGPPKGPNQPTFLPVLFFLPSCIPSCLPSFLPPTISSFLPSVLTSSLSFFFPSLSPSFLQSFLPVLLSFLPKCSIYYMGQFRFTSVLSGPEECLQCRIIASSGPHSHAIWVY